MTSLKIGVSFAVVAPGGLRKNWTTIHETTLNLTKKTHIRAVSCDFVDSFYSSGGSVN